MERTRASAIVRALAIVVLVWGFGGSAPAGVAGCARAISARRMVLRLARRRPAARLRDDKSHPRPAAEVVRELVPLLLVEDNPTLAGSLAKGLREDGYEVEIVATLAGARQRLAHPDLDAIVLDLGLPDGDGLDLLVELRDRGGVLPVLVLTARDAVRSRVTALEKGADDYLIKPFQYDELVARIRALIRRASQPRWAPLACNGLVLDAGDLAVQNGRTRVRLSPREHALLAMFLRRQGEVVSRAEILQAVFGYGFDPGTNLVNVHIANVRKKLGNDTVKIETVRGIGYRLRAVNDG
jgi:DNA-binding response OmpR family regulator